MDLGDVAYYLREELTREERASLYEAVRGTDIPRQRGPLDDALAAKVNRRTCA